MEDNNLNPIQNENETTIVRNKNIPDVSKDIHAPENRESLENMEQELGINKKVLVGLGAGAVVAGGAIYLSANDGEKWKELWDNFFPNTPAEGQPETGVPTDAIKNAGPKELYDAQGKVVYVKPTSSETQLSEFGQAFKTARESGLQQFEWNGNFYHTKLKEEMSDFIGNHKVTSNQNPIADLDHRVSKIEEKLEIQSDSRSNEQGRVASSILDRSDNSDKSADFGFADENDDGIKDTIAIDTNNNGKIDKIFMDTNYDGKFDTVMTDTNNDGILDIQISDTDGNGFTTDDQSEGINYEINMIEYESMDENDDSLSQLDTLDSIF